VPGSVYDRNKLQNIGRKSILFCFVLSLWGCELQSPHFRDLSANVI
jgi:hypothetical protein